MNQVGKEEIRDKAISFEKIDTNLQGKINIIGTGTLQTSNKTLIPAINELFQSGVDIQNIAKSALNAAGISYSDNQLRTLVNTMGNNLYTQAMKDKLQQAIQNAGGNIGSGSFDEIINSIGGIKGKSTSGSIPCVCDNILRKGSGMYGNGTTIYTASAGKVNINPGFNIKTLIINYNVPYSLYYSNGNGTKVGVLNCYYIQSLYPNSTIGNINGMVIALNQSDLGIFDVDSDYYIWGEVSRGAHTTNSIVTSFTPFSKSNDTWNLNWFAMGE